MSTGYLVVLEGDDASGYSAYSPDLPGVIATGATPEECEALMREAIVFHIEGLIEDGDPVPPPSNAAAQMPAPGPGRDGLTVLITSQHDQLETAPGKTR